LVKTTIVFITAVLLLGCTSKSEKDLMETYSSKISYHKQLQKTEKTQLYQDNETKVMLTATYLYTPSDEKNDSRDEVFIVGLHLHDEADQNINNSEYNLALNGEVPSEIQVLSTDDERLKEVSFITDWAEYYLVSFPHVDSKRVTLVFESERYGKGTLHFAKVAKYVLNKEAF